MDEQNNGAQEPAQQQDQPVAPAQPAARITLTPRWNSLMNMHRDVFDEVWAEDIKDFDVNEMT